jgi:hypothetical protein
MPAGTEAGARSVSPAACAVSGVHGWHPHFTFEQREETSP